jgi:ComF family protein
MGRQTGMLGQIAKRLVWTLGDVVSPNRCGACDVQLERRALLCPACAATVERWRGQGDPIAFGIYGGALAQVLLRLKYGRRADLAVGLGELLCDCVTQQRSQLGRIDGVVVVPVPRSRLRERGYNQAALLARSLIPKIGHLWAPLALARREGGQKQAALNRADRLRNLQGAFWVRQPEIVRGRGWLLVDDISTTGATLAACRSALWEAGAVSVRSAVVARADSFAVGA